MFPNLKIFKALSSSSGLISSSSSSLSPRKMVVELIGKWKGRSCFKLKEKYKNKTKAHTHWPQPWITAFSRWKWKAITLGPATACERARAGWGVWSSRAAWWKGGHSAPDPHSYRGEGFLRQILLQHQAGSPWSSAGSHRALYSHLQRVYSHTASLPSEGAAGQPQHLTAIGALAHSSF